MKTLRWIGAVAVLTLVAAPAARAQQPAKPGPEHEVLKKHVGTWDLTMKFAGAETKGTATYKMDLGGLWLASTFDGEVFGQKFSGRGMDTYDAARKKYVSVWFDSMSTYPMTMEGTFDPGKKALTLVGEGPGWTGSRPGTRP
jgi:hypothetical protein